VSDHTFCRTVLRFTMIDVRKRTTVAERKAAWAYRSGLIDDQAEFHGPGDFYWHGRAHCLYEARAKGWAAWLQEKGFDGVRCPECGSWGRLICGVCQECSDAAKLEEDIYEEEQWEAEKETMTPEDYAGAQETSIEQQFGRKP
jgi:hypothetical protein